MNPWIHKCAAVLLATGSISLPFAANANDPAPKVQKITFIEDDAQKNMASKIYQLKNTTAAEIAPFIRNAVVRYCTESHVSALSDKANKRQLLIVSTGINMIEYVDKLVAALDRKANFASDAAITGDGIGVAKEISMSANNDNIAVDINIAALNGKTIKDIQVSISSDPADFQNLVSTLFPTLSGTFSIVDFSDAAGAERKAVLGPGADGLGLIDDPDTDPIFGKTSYTFRIGRFMGALASTGLSEGTLCNFSMKVIDSEDKEATATCVIKMVK